VYNPNLILSRQLAFVMTVSIVLLTTFFFDQSASCSRQSIPRWPPADFSPAEPARFPRVQANYIHLWVSPRTIYHKVVPNPGYGVSVAVRGQGARASTQSALTRTQWPGSQIACRRLRSCQRAIADPLTSRLSPRAPLDKRWTS
jgi:hypothetical protein